MRDDGFGLFWDEPTRRKATGTARPAHVLPPVPDTGWLLPTDADFKDLRGQGMIAVDVESFDPKLKTHGSGTFRGDNRIVGIALGTEAGWRRYFPFGHENGPQLERAKVLAYAREQLAINVPKVGANLRYDLELLANEGVPVVGPHYDVQNAEPLLDENKLRYNLESLGVQWLGEGKKQDEINRWLAAAFGEEHIKENIWRAPIALAGPYAESDVDLPLRIFAHQRAQLKEEPGLWELFQLETKLVPMLLAMRQRGVPVNIPAAEQLLEQLTGEQKKLVDEIHRQTGYAPDLWASDSLAKLFDGLGLPYPRTASRLSTKDGREIGDKPSFTKEWLKHNPHPVAKLVMEARGIDKLKGTFVQNYILEGHVNGRIHCMFNQLRSDDGGTVSGRLSSNGPNLQNIPVRTDVGKLIRKIFIAEAGQTWWKFDWSQIEYRLIAHYAAKVGKALGPAAQAAANEVVEKYRTDPNTDYHQAVADQLGWEGKKGRGDAKNLNFGLAYGQGLDLLCYNLGVGRSEGEAIIAEYHKRSPFIRALSRYVGDVVDGKKLGADGRDRIGVIRTLMGRMRHFNMFEKDDPNHPGSKIYFRSKVPGSRRAHLHKVLNALIQGGAADINKAAMVSCYEAGLFEPDALGAPHLTVHDELDGSHNGSPRAREALREVKRRMEDFHLLVPLIAEGSEGPNWGTQTALQ